MAPHAALHPRAAPPCRAMYQDPLERLRHAIVGVCLALIAAVLTAALAGRWLGDLIADRYSLRVGIYLGLSVYLLVGGAVLFARVARHETQPVSPGRVARWYLSLWLWPLLLLVARPGGKSDSGDRPDPPRAPD